MATHEQETPAIAQEGEEGMDIEGSGSGSGGRGTGDSAPVEAIKPSASGLSAAADADAEPEAEDTVISAADDAIVSPPDLLEKVSAPETESEDSAAAATVQDQEVADEDMGMDPQDVQQPTTATAAAAAVDVAEPQQQTTTLEEGNTQTAVSTGDQAVAVVAVAPAAAVDPQQTAEEGNANMDANQQAQNEPPQSAPAPSVPVPVPVNPNQLQSNNRPPASQELPWHKKYRGILIVLLLLVVAGAVVAVVLVNQNNNVSGDIDQNKALIDEAQSSETDVPEEIPLTNETTVNTTLIPANDTLPTNNAPTPPSGSDSSLIIDNNETGVSISTTNNNTEPIITNDDAPTAIVTDAPISTESSLTDDIYKTDAPSSSVPTPTKSNIMPTNTDTTEIATNNNNNAPTGSTALQATIEKLIPLSGEEAFFDKSSPQYKAAEWMTYYDPIPNPSSSWSTGGGTGLDLDDPRFEQRYIMALFYYAMDGINWKNNQGWLTSQSECEWYGIDGVSLGCGGKGLGGCIKGSSGLAGDDDDYDKICRIGMGRLNRLYGEIPSELGQLSEMRWFEIQDDYLIGTIPDALGTGWSKLHTFLVGGNFLQGGFPSTFENNDMLGTIFVDRNRFDGTFPRVFGSLKNLKWLDADGNNFVGELPDEIGDIKSLRILNVNSNNMTGYLPDTWDETNLIEDFEVANNNFTGPLPASLGNAKFLKDLRANRNQLSGSIPSSYYNLQHLEEIYLDENDLVGELSQTAEPFYDGLQEFSIHSNNFEGRFPVEHFESTFRIKVLSLHNNDLTGTITDNICARRDPSLAYTQLTELTADCDSVECECCTCYKGGQIVSIFYPTPPPSATAIISPTAPSPVEENEDLLDQDKDYIRPTRAPNSPTPDRSDIRPQIERDVLQRGASFDDMDDSDPRYLALKWILDKDQRELTTDDTNLPQRYVLALIAFSLDSLAWYVCGDHRDLWLTGEEYVVEDCEIQNYLTGQLESHKVWLSSTEECHWYGVICDDEGVVRGVELIGNDLIGELPPEISELSLLQYLALSGNCLYGTIPHEIGNLQVLLSLELHGNGLSGAFPEELYGLDQLQLLNVAIQPHSQQCYRSDGELADPLYLMGDAANGYNYGLEGNVLGPDVGLWQSMKGLHLFDNSFTGEIADEIGDLEDLRFLRAYNNLFELQIPSAIVKLTNLRELYLGNNVLWSDLPSDIGLMEALEVLHVNENEMYGALPDSLYNLSNMKKLWLQDTIRCEQVDTLEWGCRIDSDYGFEGSIQTEIGNMGMLSQLLINNNPFTGTLPTELGLCENLSVLHMHKTDIGGSVPDEVCLLRDKNLNSESGAGVFYADCLTNNATQEPFIECSCCSDCCDHTTQVCIADD